MLFFGDIDEGRICVIEYYVMMVICMDFWNLVCKYYLLISWLLYCLNWIGVI